MSNHENCRRVRDIASEQNTHLHSFHSRSFPFTASILVPTMFVSEMHFRNRPDSGRGAIACYKVTFPRSVSQGICIHHVLVGRETMTHNLSLLEKNKRRGGEVAGRPFDHVITVEIWILLRKTVGKIKIRMPLVYPFRNLPANRLIRQLTPRGPRKPSISLLII